MHDTDSELLQTLLLGFERAMLVSRSGDALRARPMTLAQTRDTKRIWLLSGVMGDRLDELAEDPNVNVVLQDGLRFCSVSGTARVARHACENPSWSGPERRSPLAASRTSLLLIQVTPQFAEYWDRSGLKGLKFEAAEAGEPCELRVRPAQARHVGREAAERPRFGNVIPLERARWKK